MGRALRIMDAWKTVDLSKEYSLSDEKIDELKKYVHGLFPSAESVMIEQSEYEYHVLISIRIASYQVCEEVWSEYDAGDFDTGTRADLENAKTPEPVQDMLNLVENKVSNLAFEHRRNNEEKHV